MFPLNPCCSSFYCLCCPIMLLYALSSMLSCPLRCPHKNYVRIDFYLQLLVGEVMSYLRYLCLFAYSAVQHILCCVCFFLRLVCPILQVSLDCPFLIALRYSLTFISLCSRHSDKHNVSHIDLQSVFLMDHQRFPVGLQWFSMVQWFSMCLYYFFMDRTHRSFPVGFILFMWVLHVFILILDFSVHESLKYLLIGAECMIFKILKSEKKSTEAWKVDATFF